MYSLRPAVESMLWKAEVTYWMATLKKTETFILLSKIKMWIYSCGHDSHGPHSVPMHRYPHVCLLICPPRKMALLRELIFLVGFYNQFSPNNMGVSFLYTALSLSLPPGFLNILV